MHTRSSLIPAVSILGGIGAALLVAAALLYTLPRQNAVTVAVGKSFHLPFARVYGYPVYLNQVFADYDVLKYLEKDGSLFSDDELRRRVWSRIREEYATRSLADDYDITATSAELDLYVKQFLKNTDLTLSDFFTSIPNFDLRHFKKHIILPMLLKEKISKHLLLTQENDAKNEIIALYERLRLNPDEFVPLVRQRASEQKLEYKDPVGLIAARELSQKEIDLLHRIPSGGITPVIVRLDGYRIYQVISYFTEPEEAWQLRELFVPAPLFDQELTERLASPDEKIYVKGIIPSL